MWNIRKFVLSNPVNAWRNNICRHSSSPSLLFIYTIIYGFISWFYIWEIVQISVLRFSMVQKKNEQIRVPADDCTRTRTRLWPLHYLRQRHLPFYGRNSHIRSMSLRSNKLFALHWRMFKKSITYPCKNTSTLTQLWTASNWYHGQYVALSFKVTPTLYPSNTMLAIPYSLRTNHAYLFAILPYVLPI